MSAVCLFNGAYAWNGALHSAIAAIAEANLTPEAKSEIAKISDNESIVLNALWMDNRAEVPGFEATLNWHNVAITKANKVVPVKKALKAKRDIEKTALAFEGLETVLKVLENRGAHSKAEVFAATNELITILADLHCPTHYIYQDMSEADMNPFYFHGTKTKSEDFKNFWEGNCIFHSFPWKTREFVHQLSRKSAEEVAALTSGSITKWVESNAVRYRWIYEVLPNGTRFKGNDYRLWGNKIYPFSTEIVAEAGYRIASVLNGLFDPAVPQKSLK